MGERDEVAGVVLEGEVVGYPGRGGGEVRGEERREREGRRGEEKRVSLVGKGLSRSGWVWG